MKNIAKKVLATVLTAAVVGSVGQAQIASAAPAYVPPADRIVKEEIHRTMTVPNSINVTLKDDSNNPLNGGTFELLDSNGKVVAQWTGNNELRAATENRRFNRHDCVIRGDQLYETGEYIGRILIPFGGGHSIVERDSMYLTTYGKKEKYVSYGNKMAKAPHVTIPAGEVWVNVGKGYKRADSQNIARQFVQLNGVDYDLSDLAGNVQKVSLPAGAHGTKIDQTFTSNISYGDVDSASLTSSDKAEEYVALTLNLHTYYSKFVDADGKHSSSTKDYVYGAPTVQDANNITSAFLQITSGAVTNFVSLENGPVTTIYVKKGDYEPRVTCSFSYKIPNGSGGGGGNNNIPLSIYDYAKHYVDVVAPPEMGTTVAYIPAGTYTLHQTATAKGYLPAPDQKITVKDSYKVEDMQKIEVINAKEHVHTFSDSWSKDETSHWHAATCEHTDLIKDKADHTYGPWKVTLEPTTETEGVQERSCTVCGHTQKESIAKLPPEEKPVDPDNKPVDPDNKPVEPDNKPTEPDNKPTEPDNKPDNSPQTGEKSHVAVWAVVAIIACVVLIATFPLLKKKNNK